MKPFLVLAAMVSLPMSARAADWRIDPEHSSASFTIKHIMVSSVRGTFGKITGTVHQDDADISKSTVDVVIPTDDIDTRVPKRDEHLKSKAFFDVKRFPEIRFKSTRVEPAGKNMLRITGDLTMHGVTRPVELAVELADKVWKETFPDPANKYGQLNWGASAKAKLSRKDFGLTWDIRPDELKYVETGGVMVGDEVSIEIDVLLIRPAPAGP